MAAVEVGPDPPAGVCPLVKDVSIPSQTCNVLCTEFRSVLAFRQHHHMPHYFDCSDLYFICRLHPLTFDLYPCEKEVVRCEWMNIHELATSQEVLSSVHTYCMYLQWMSSAGHSPDPADGRPHYQQSQ